MNYTVYSNLGFIGLAFVQTNGNTKSAYLHLWEAVEQNNNIYFIPIVPPTSITRIYTIPDLDVLKDVVTTAIPSKGTNGLNYFAFDTDGVRHDI